MKSRNRRSSTLPLACLRYLRYRIRRVQRLRDTPQSIACGLGIGAFSACLPLLGGQTAVAIILAIALRGNKFCAVLTTWLSNPLTYLPIFWVNYLVGLWLLPTFSAPKYLRWTSMDFMLDRMRDLSVPLGLGSLVNGIVLGVTVYTAALWIFRRRAVRSQQRARVAALRRELRARERVKRQSILSAGKPSKIVEYNQ